MSFEKGRAKTGGRASGVQNHATRDIRAIAQGLIEDPAYRVSLRKRLLKGISPQLEVLLHYYAYGKPKSEIKGDMALHITINRMASPSIGSQAGNELRMIEDQSTIEQRPSDS